MGIKIFAFIYYIEEMNSGLFIVIIIFSIADFSKRKSLVSPREDKKIFADKLVDAISKTKKIIINDKSDSDKEDMQKLRIVVSVKRPRLTGLPAVGRAIR